MVHCKTQTALQADKDASGDKSLYKQSKNTLTNKKTVAKRSYPEKLFLHLRGKA